MDSIAVWGNYGGQPGSQGDEPPYGEWTRTGSWSFSANTLPPDGPYYYSNTGWTGYYNNNPITGNYYSDRYMYGNRSSNRGTSYWIDMLIPIKQGITASRYGQRIINTQFTTL